MSIEDSFGDDDLFADADLLDTIESEAIASKVNKSAPKLVQRDMFGGNAPVASTSAAVSRGRSDNREKLPILKVSKVWDRSVWQKVGWGGAASRAAKGKGKGKRRADDSDDEDEEDEPDTSLDSAADVDLSPNSIRPEMILTINQQEAKTWIYPTNKQLRDYQFNIARKALFNNILCSLPTGLGKTFIAAVVMLNFYRWFPEGKVIFMAPTRPLVAQQIEACHAIAGIPCEDAAEMTGNDAPALREQAWRMRRVFYCTPQTVANDLKKGRLDPKRVVCIVVDEAHKASGDYAYCSVVRFLMTKNSHFRILALTATPGSKPEAVQNVVDALHIGHIEVRTDASIDIQQYMHRKETSTLIVDLPPEFAKIRDAWAKLMDALLQPLIANKLIYPAKALSLHSFACQKALQNLGRSGGNGWAFPLLSQLGEMARGMEYLLTQSITSFKEVLDSMKDKARQAQKKNKMTATVESSEFKTIFREVEHLMNAPGMARHPKMDLLQGRILDHFTKHFDNKTETRVMVFSSYRLVVEEIVAVLNKHKPMIKATKFVGQGSDKKGNVGFNQKKQLETIRDFKAGLFNVLVATSIGEEGLDIGEVDIIYCYETSKSPIRMLQRIGRTGRARDGEVVVLMTRDREDRNWDKAKSGYDDVQNAIVSGKAFEMYSDCDLLNPNKNSIECVKKNIEAAPFDKGSIGLSNLISKARAEKKPKVVKDPKRNIPANALGFQKASKKMKAMPSTFDALQARKSAALLDDDQYTVLLEEWQQPDFDLAQLLDISRRPFLPVPTSKKTARPLQETERSRKLREAISFGLECRDDEAKCEKWEKETFRHFNKRNVHWWRRDQLGTASRLYVPCRPVRTLSAPLNMALAGSNSRKGKQSTETEDHGGLTDDELDAALAALSSNAFATANKAQIVEIEDKDNLEDVPMLKESDDESDEALPDMQPVKFRSTSNSVSSKTSQTKVKVPAETKHPVPKRKLSVEPVLAKSKARSQPIDLDSEEEVLPPSPAKSSASGPLMFPVPTFPTDSSDEEERPPIAVKPEDSKVTHKPKPRISDEFDISMDFGDDALAEIDALAAAHKGKPVAAPPPKKPSQPSHAGMPAPAIPAKRKAEPIIEEPVKAPKLQSSQNYDHLRKTFTFKPPLARRPDTAGPVIPLASGSSSSPAVLGPGMRRGRKVLQENEVNRLLAAEDGEKRVRRLKPVAATQAAESSKSKPQGESSKTKVTSEKTRKKRKKAPVTTRNNQFLANSQAEDSTDDQSDSSVYQSSENSQDRKFVANDNSCDVATSDGVNHHALTTGFQHSPVIPGAFKMKFRGNAQFAATQRRSSSPISDYCDDSGVVPDEATIVYDSE